MFRDPDSFHVLLADCGEKLFDDYNFQYLYCEDNGRPCVPPSQMFVLLYMFSVSLSQQKMRFHWRGQTGHHGIDKTFTALAAGRKYAHQLSVNQRPPFAPIAC